MSNQLRKRYDIIINGGGIVGFTLLNLLQKSAHLNKCKILLIEQANRPSNLKQPARQAVESSSNTISDISDDRFLFSNRVSSITRKSKNILEKLGVWSDIKPYSKDVKSIKVWNYDYSDKIIFNPEITNQDPEQDVIFSVVENNRLSIALLKRISLDSSSDVDVIKWNNNLQNLSQTDGTIEIVTKDTNSSEEFVAHAPLLLGCDGFKSKVREFSRLKYTEFSLDKTAVVGTVKISPSSSDMNQDNDVAYQKFSSEKDTVAALLPLTDKYSSFVISAPNEYAKYLRDCDEETFLNEFNRLLESKESPDNAILKSLHNLSNDVYKYIDRLALNRLQANPSNPSNSFGNDEPPRLESLLENSRAMFPLIFGTTSPRMIANLPGRDSSQIALLGDSSHRVHPLAGQGLNLGIQDAGELVEQLEEIAKCGERIFDDNDQGLLSKALKKYECKRQSYILPMSAGILSMPYLFKFTPPWLISAVNKVDCIKSASVKYANGS